MKMLPDSLALKYGDMEFIGNTSRDNLIFIIHFV